MPSGSWPQEERGIICWLQRQSTGACGAYHSTPFNLIMNIIISRALKDLQTAMDTCCCVIFWHLQCMADALLAFTMTAHNCILFYYVTSPCWTYLIKITFEWLYYLVSRGLCYVALLNTIHHYFHSTCMISFHNKVVEEQHGDWVEGKSRTPFQRRDEAHRVSIFYVCCVGTSLHVSAAQPANRLPIRARTYIYT